MLQRIILKIHKTIHMKRICEAEIKIVFFDKSLAFKCVVVMVLLAANLQVMNVRMSWKIVHVCGQN